ncbi:MAG: hypothetical protein ABII00_03100 [Elusimicrobiota bacterium]
MESFNLAQLTKEMVVTQIRNLADPTLLAAEVVRGTVIARLKGHRLSNYEIQEAVMEVCRGAVAGLVLMECPMGRGAAAILRGAMDASSAAGVDAELVEIAAIKGLADARRFVSEETLSQMRARLDAARVEAGQLFDYFCGSSQQYQSHPGYVAPKY